MLRSSANWTNNGDQFSLQGTVSFIGSGNAQISGTGTTTEFYDIILNKTSANDRLDVLSTAFSANNPFLSLERGIFHIGGTFSFTNNFFSILNYTINSNSGLWLDNENVIFTVKMPVCSSGLASINERNNQHWCRRKRK
jgi:hypothetical protein